MLDADAKANVPLSVVLSNAERIAPFTFHPASTSSNTFLSYLISTAPDRTFEVLEILISSVTVPPFAHDLLLVVAVVLAANTDMVFPLGSWLDTQLASGQLSQEAYNQICFGNAQRVFGI